MKLTFLGATHEVTGSCYYLEACGQRIVIDCGMEQGKDIFVNQPLPVDPGQVDMVLLTHAHIDHSGKLPLLVKGGFTGQIFSTEGTRLLCEIMLQDSAHIQESEAEWKNRKAKRAGRPPVEPLYTVQDALDTMKCFVGLEYDQPRQIAPGIVVRFVDAGHLLGSASIELRITQNGVTKTLVFSGDIGNLDQPLINDPVYLHEADYVVMESTYGNRVHERPADYTTMLAAVLQDTFDRGGNVVIPSFAVGRTQEMLYFIRHIKEKKMVHGHDGFEVYVDSPLAVEATTVFQKRMFRDFDREATDLLNQGINPIGFDGLKVSVTSEDSKAINTDPNPKVILSASGMCDAGRIRHHLKYNLWRADSTILFVGYQSEGTLGRNLVDGAGRVKLFGEEIAVKAKIQVLPGISGHADSNGLIAWIRAFDRKKPAKVFVTHGEDTVTELFARRLREELGLDAYAPYSGTVFDLASGQIVTEGVPQRIGSGKQPVSTETAGQRERGTKENAQRRMGDAYGELVAAARQLLDVAQRSEGGANADLKKFTKQVNELIRQWER